MTKTTNLKIKDVSLTLVFISALIGVAVGSNANAASTKTIENTINNMPVTHNKIARLAALLEPYNFIEHKASSAQQGQITNKGNINTEMKNNMVNSLMLLSLTQ